MTDRRRLKFEVIRLAAEIEKLNDTLMSIKGDNEMAINTARKLALLYSDNWEIISWALRIAGGGRPSTPEPRSKRISR